MMKALILYISFLFCLSVSGQVQTLYSSRLANELVYDSNTNRIYATISSADNDLTYKNSLSIINPEDGVTENSFQFDIEPTAIAIADDGSYIYIGFKNSSQIKRFNLNTQSVDLEFSAGAFTTSEYPEGIDYYINDIEVKPGDPSTIAVTRYYSSSTMKVTLGIALFKDGVQEPNSYGDEDLSGESEPVHKIKFKNATTLFGHTYYDVIKFNINNNGVTFNNIYEDVINISPFSYKSDFIFHNDKAYFKNGKVLNMAATPSPSGTLTPATNGAVVYDTSSNLICSVYAGNLYDENGNMFLRRYDPETYQLHDEIELTAWGGTTENIVTCGNGSLAFNSFTNYVDNGEPQGLYIIKDLSLSVKNVSIPTVKIFPNPSLDLIIINTDEKIFIKNIDIYGISGNLVLQTKNINNKVDIRNLSQGLYLIKLTDENDNTYTQKIVKI